MTSTVADATPDGQTQPVRWLLRIVLLVLSIAAVCWFYYANSHTEAYHLAYPRFEPWLWNLYLTCPLASLIGMFALWSRRRWGMWLLVIVAALMIGIEVYAMGFQFRTLAVPAALALIWFTARPAWNNFR